MQTLILKSQEIKPYSSEYFKFKMYVTFEGLNTFYTALLKDKAEATEAINKLMCMINKCNSEKIEVDAIKAHKESYLISLAGCTVSELHNLERTARENMFNDNLQDAEQFEYSGMYQAIQILKRK